MNLSRTTRRLVLATAVAVSTTAMPSIASAQDSLARAKDFYAAAAYEEALVVLQRLNAANPGTDRNEVSAYQAFCLVALGRSEEARKTIESLVRVDPLYKLSDAQASPRVRAFFDDVRRPLLPEIVKQTYSRAKDAYDRKELASAATEFDRAIALIDEVGAANDRALGDLRTLATGFRDLAKAAAAPPPPPPTPPAATEAATGETGCGQRRGNPRHERHGRERQWQHHIKPGRVEDSGRPRGARVGADLRPTRHRRHPSGVDQARDAGMASVVGRGDARVQRLD